MFRHGIVNRQMETHLRTGLGLMPLDMAFGQRHPSRAIHHSDQGVHGEFTHYASVAAGKRSEQPDFRPSMGSVGDSFAAAMCERFFAILACELLTGRGFRNEIEA